MAVKSFRITATATARFKNVVIAAKSKKEAEEKFRKIYASAFPFEIDFGDVNAVPGPLLSRMYMLNFTYLKGSAHYLLTSFFFSIIR